MNHFSKLSLAYTINEMTSRPSSFFAAFRDKFNIDVAESKSAPSKRKAIPDDVLQEVARLKRQKSANGDYLSRKDEKELRQHEEYLLCILDKEWHFERFRDATALKPPSSLQDYAPLPSDLPSDGLKELLEEYYQKQRQTRPLGIYTILKSCLDFYPTSKTF
jgi:hypothetical protein